MSGMEGWRMVSGEEGMVGRGDIGGMGPWAPREDNTVIVPAFVILLTVTCEEGIVVL